MLVEVPYSYVARHKRAAERERVSMSETKGTTWFRTRAHEGFCGLIKVADGGRIKGMYVHPECRRRGIATEMVRGCIDYAKGQGWRQIEALAYLPTIYLRLGFQQVGSPRANGAVRVLLNLEPGEETNETNEG